MGVDIHVHILEKDCGKWKTVSLYSKENKKFKRIDPYPFRNGELFDILSQGFDQAEKVKLIDRAIDILTEKRKSIVKEGRDSLYRICSLKERASKLELFKELYLVE